MPKTTALIQAINAHESEELIYKLAQEPGINDQDEQGNTALMQAISRKNTEVIKLLLNAGATIEGIKNNDFKTALNFDPSIFEGNGEIGKLLKNKIKEKSKTNRPDTALMTALSQQNIDYNEIEKLAKEPGLNDQGKNGNTALMHAVFNGDRRAVDLLLEAGAIVDGIKNHNFKSALDLTNDPEIKKSLQEKVKQERGKGKFSIINKNFLNGLSFIFTGLVLAAVAIFVGIMIAGPIGIAIGVFFGIGALTSLGIGGAMTNDGIAYETEKLNDKAKGTSDKTPEIVQEQPLKDQELTTVREDTEKKVSAPQATITPPKDLDSSRAKMRELDDAGRLVANAMTSLTEEVGKETANTSFKKALSEQNINEARSILSKENIAQQTINDFFYNAVLANSLTKKNNNKAIIEFLLKEANADINYEKQGKSVLELSKYENNHAIAKLFEEHEPKSWVEKISRNDPSELNR